MFFSMIWWFATFHFSSNWHSIERSNFTKSKIIKPIIDVAIIFLQNIERFKLEIQLCDNDSEISRDILIFNIVSKWLKMKINTPKLDTWSQRFSTNLCSKFLNLSSITLLLFVSPLLITFSTNKYIKSCCCALRNSIFSKAQCYSIKQNFPFLVIHFCFHCYLNICYCFRYITALHCHHKCVPYLSY